MEATRSAFVEFIPGLIDGLAHAEEPDDAVTAFDRFLGALQRGGRLISLLEPEPRPRRAGGADPRRRAAARRHAGAAAADHGRADRSALLRRDAGPAANCRRGWPRRCRTPTSYEDFLDRLRLFGQESLFLIGTRILSGTVSAQQASVAFADVAEGIVHTVHGLVTDQFAAQYGRIKGQETAILAMGRLGSREMTASSDLDLILLYDFDHEHPDSDGERSLHGAQYFAPLDPAADLARSRRGPITACSTTSTCGCARRAAPGRWRRGSILCRLPGARGLDLGAHGADAGAGDFGVAGVPQQDRGRSSAAC